MFSKYMLFSVGTGFAVVLALMISLVVVGLTQMSSINARLERIVNADNKKIELASIMRDSLRQRIIAMHTMVNAEDRAEKNMQLQKFYGDSAHFTNARKTLDQMLSSPEEKAVLHRIHDLRASLKIEHYFCSTGNGMLSPRGKICHGINEWGNRWASLDFLT